MWPRGGVANAGAVNNEINQNMRTKPCLIFVHLICIYSKDETKYYIYLVLCAHLLFVQQPRDAPPRRPIFTSLCGARKLIKKKKKKTKRKSAVFIFINQSVAWCVVVVAEEENKKKLVTIVRTCENIASAAAAVPEKDIWKRRARIGCEISPGIFIFFYFSNVHFVFRISFCCVYIVRYIQFFFVYLHKETWINLFSCLNCFFGMWRRIFLMCELRFGTRMRRVMNVRGWGLA